MSVIQIGLIDRTRVGLNGTLVQSVAAALNVQVIRDLPQFWNIKATVTYLPRGSHIPLGVWPAMLVDQLPPGEGGVHLDKHNQPYALIAASADNDGWTLAASHEIIEMAIDPQGNFVQTSRSIEVDGKTIKDSEGEFQYLVEACDPCEAEDYAYLIQGVAVSDFLTPHFYDPGVTPGTRYSFNGSITAPRQILPGGYISWIDPVTEQWQQLRWLDSGQSPEIVTLGEAKQQQSLRAWIDGIMADHPDLRTSANIARKPRNAGLFDLGKDRRAILAEAAELRTRELVTR